MKYNFFLILICLFFIGCASTQKTYSQLVNERQTPKTESEIQKECTWIRSEMADINGRIDISGVTLAPLQAAIVKKNLYQNLSVLESRAANIGCSSGFSTVIVKDKSSIQECIDACKENTRFSSEECFEKCKKP